MEEDRLEREGEEVLETKPKERGRRKAREGRSWERWSLWGGEGGAEPVGRWEELMILGRR